MKVEWAKDNGRGGEFIKKRKYTKAKYCFECGVCSVCSLFPVGDWTHVVQMPSQRAGRSREAEEEAARR